MAEGIAVRARPLHYYETDTGHYNTTTPELLRDADGQCHAWADLFKEPLLANNVANVHFTLIEPSSGYEGFAVKNIGFADPPSYPSDPDYWYYATGDLDNVKNSLWVEGYQDNSTPSNLTLEYHWPGGALACSDTVKYTFIAALCGDQPNPQHRAEFAGWFPNLVHCEWSIPWNYHSQVFNCIAWSVDETNCWYNDVGVCNHPAGFCSIDWHWGNRNGGLEAWELDAFYLEKKGYTPTASGGADAQVQYYSGYHAAKKRGCSCGAGKWIMFESKCGPYEIIEHVHDQLDRGDYGSAIRFYK